MISSSLTPLLPYPPPPDAHAHDLALVRGLTLLNVAQVQSVMQNVASACGFSLAEALQPREDGRCLVQTGVSWHRDLASELFHKHSSDLIFPPNVGIPGRCWKLRRVQLHADVTALPPTIFLRSEMAEKAGLRGCVAIPLHVEGTQQFVVTMYLAPYDLYDQNLAREISDKALEVTRQVLQQAGAGSALWYKFSRVLFIW